MRCRLAVHVVAGIAAPVLVLAGCQSGDPTLMPTGTSPGNATVRDAHKASGHVARSADERLGLTLERIAVQPSDLAAGYSRKLFVGGNQVAGQVTLDNCGYHFTTEKDRQVRRQYGILGPAGQQTGLSNELVAYRTARDAARAITQWVISSRTCPRRPVASTVADVPRMRYRVRRLKRDTATLPVPDNAVTIEAAITQAHQHLDNVAILQRRGRYLDNIYLTVAGHLTQREIAVTVDLAQATGRRLATKT